MQVSTVGVELNTDKNRLNEFICHLPYLYPSADHTVVVREREYCEKESYLCFVLSMKRINANISVNKIQNNMIRTFIKRE